MIENNPKVVYGDYLHQISEKDKKKDMGYSKTIYQQWLTPDNIEQEKKSFLEKTEHILKDIDPDAIQYHKYCIEWKENNKIYVEFLIGFLK